MINDAFGISRDHVNVEAWTSHQPVHEGEERMPELNQGPNEEAKAFYDLVRDGNQALYEGCTKYSKLSFLVKLYHIKCLCGLSNKAMSMILELLKDAFEHAKIPDSFYEAKKLITKLGLNYSQIHACPNDCMLYWGEDESRETCKVCNTSRWKQSRKGNPTNMSSGGKKRKKKPVKVLRYFPLKPRLQRLFMSSKTAEHMRWHSVDSNKDGLMRHPRDSEAWKRFDETHIEFASDPRNVRLGLASDGFNPFRTLSTNYSIWPVILIPYNLPPWMCMKQTSFILSMIIPGKQMPGNDIDVYLQPLIKDLKDLWDGGVETFDASLNQMFNMRAALMWTISDFPGLGNLSGWNTHTGSACPTCNFDTVAHRLPHSRKWSFMGHRRFLEPNHRFRFNRVHFDGNTEFRNPPVALSGSEIFKQLENVHVTFGKGMEVEDNRKRTHRKNTVESGCQQWRKKSIFFQLPYWEYNLLRHNLDVMHIEKNVCDNVLYTILNESGKTKDNLNARKDLKEMGVRSDLWPNENGQYRPTLFTMSNAQKDVFLTTLKNVLVPDGYSSNIARCIDLKHRKIFGLKSHDSHILMEQLLPISIRNVLPNQVSAVLVDLCSIFRQICGKVLNPLDFDKLQRRVILTQCHMEMLFPPGFFTIMVHLVVHLVNELKLGGPVHYRWMYPIERYLGHLKSYVRNRAQPEGSIAEGYLAEECLTFCSRYLEGIETRFNQLGRVDDQTTNNESSQVSMFFTEIGKSVGSTSYFNLTHIEKRQAHRYVLMNSELVDRFVKISDNNPVNGDVNYYGKLVDIIELNYYGRFRIILFKCKWANTITDRGIKQDALQFTLVNFSRLIHTGEREEDEPYIEASQAQQVYYVEDVVEKDWSAVVHLKPRDLYDMGEDTEETFYENEPYQTQDLGLFFPNDTGILSLARGQIDDDPMPNVENVDDEDDEDM
ncbi:uncharacterized protein LOC127805620 [Diospyros lotus]|uniref:uncharacterized protein LOC127805620 n=1 Tax=Diospyros lotus TaxID=55363 RepID=UPI00225B0F2C|nr:uncharacterized protein LOC127805620 [Diospyros lotus]